MTKWNKDIIVMHIQEFYNSNGRSPVDKDFYKHSVYPNPTTVKGYFGSWNKALEAASVPFTKEQKPKDFWTKESTVAAIQKFYNQHGRIPSARDFNKNSKYPAASTVYKLFTNWNTAIQVAGLMPNTNNGLGITTTAIDGHAYRSQAEAHFVNTYLYGHYEYIIEPKYPYPHNRYYDWYIPSIDLYIELDGGIRPEVIKQKTQINKNLNRNCLFIKISKIYSKKQLTDFL